MNPTYCVIMAGGIGSRFWPVSTSKYPKQFHDILGTGETLIQQTFRRLCLITDPEKILVVTHKDYRDQVAEQLPGMPQKNILLEPARRNTAPCITYAMFRIFSESPQANVLIAPSDHIITKESEFTRITKIALQTAQENPFLLTLGINAHRPDTGYGYIQFEEPTNGLNEEVKKVKTFTEKPDSDLAKQFLASGDFLWNSGIFLWSVPTYMKQVERHLPDMNQVFNDGLHKFGTDEETEFVDRIYPSCENESIDYGLMEKSDEVYVIPSSFGWSDLGTWGSLYEQIDRDEDGNALIGKSILTYESKNNIIKANGNKIVVVEGLKDHIVIDNDNALLICKMEHEQWIKSFLSDVKVRFERE